MPNLTLEYTANLHSQFDVPDTLLKLNQALVATGAFKEADIKSRALPLEVFVVGTAPTERAFIHLELSILSGRAMELKRDVSHELLHVLKQQFEHTPKFEVQLCVQVLDNDRDTYSKVSLRSQHHI